jgi:hypothetical protein
MGESGASRAIGVGQVAGIVAFTLALFFVIAFATKSVEAYRLRSWRDRLQGEIDEMHRRRRELEAEITRRQSMSWVDEALRDAGWVAEGVVAVMAIPADPVSGPETAEVAEGGAAPLPTGGEFFRNRYWEAWRRLIWGFGD